MRFCNHCIVDGELHPIIEGLGMAGDFCPVCEKRKVFIYDTDIHSRLTENFEQLLEIYTPESMLPLDFPHTEKRLLVTELTDRWHIFNDKLTPTDVLHIIRAICAEKYASMPSLFNTLIGIADLNDEQSLKENSLLRTNSWNDFVKSLREQNRFHTKHIELTILERFCTYIRKVYKKGTVFYRGRISTEDGFPLDEMGAPPSDKASAGRANSAGIRCLYLASDLDTTLHEVRAGVFDYVTIGRPLRRSDTILDYIPTQYVADFIKSILHEGKPEYAGIEYNSTLNRRGQNLAIFYPDLFDCTDVEIYHINQLKYEYEKDTF